MITKILLIALPIIILTSFANEVYSEEAKSIPDWLKNNFQWYVEEKISQKELLTSMNWLLDNNYMHLSEKAAKEVQELRNENKMLKKQVVQYGQTDFDFLKRSASNSDEIPIILYPGQEKKTMEDEIMVLLRPLDTQFSPEDEIMVLLRPAAHKDFYIGVNNAKTISDVHKKWIDVLSINWDASDDQSMICPKTYTPVCGTDGKTYGNSCEAKKAGTEVSKQGECAAKCAIQCLVYDPVCGVDGKTYACGKEDASCNGVSVAYVGECKSQTCPDVYTPVCGTDGKTYGNSCEAKKAGATIKHEGTCAAEICPKTYTPVCGTDGKTYGNSCEAKKAGATISYEGVCKAPVRVAPSK